MCSWSIGKEVDQEKEFYWQTETGVKKEKYLILQEICVTDSVEYLLNSLRVETGKNGEFKIYITILQIF